MRKIEINLYSYKELDDKAKKKIFRTTIQQIIDNYLVEVPILDKDSNDVGEKVASAIKEAERVHTPWFAELYIRESLGDNEIEDMIEAQGEIFLENGYLFVA